MQAFLDWLVADFDAYGAHFQNWMPIVGAALAIFILGNWQDHRRSRS